MHANRRLVKRALATGCGDVYDRDGNLARVDVRADSVFDEQGYVGFGVLVFTGMSVGIAGTSDGLDQVFFLRAAAGVQDFVDLEVDWVHCG